MNKRDHDKQSRQFHIGSQNDALYIVSGEAPALNNDYPRHDADRTCIAKVYDEAEAKRLVDAANAGLVAVSHVAAITEGETPRTDALYCPEFGMLLHVDTAEGYEHACKLERELADMSMRVMRKAEECAELSARSATATPTENPYKRAWEDWRSMQTGDARKMMDDALRYRWLRDHDMTQEYSEYITGNLNGRGVDPLDATIDKAISRTDGGAD